MTNIGRPATSNGGLPYAETDAPTGDGSRHRNRRITASAKGLKWRKP
jgi:hypothetical protein